MLRSLLGLVLLLPLLQPTPAPLRVSVRLTGVRAERGGVLHVGLHRDPGVGFPGPSAFENLTVPATAPSIIVTFDVPPGGYAVAVHHDANGNGRIDSNFLGIPREGYGVSNDIVPRFSAPRFRDARVTLARDTALTVPLHY